MPFVATVKIPRLAIRLLEDRYAVAKGQAADAMRGTSGRSTHKALFPPLNVEGSLQSEPSKPLVLPLLLRFHVVDQKGSMNMG